MLQDIINNDGRCKRWCKSCPFSTLVKRQGGGYENCFTVVIGESYPDGGYDAKYKAAAKKLLLDLIMEDILEDD